MFEINSEKWVRVRIHVCVHVFVVCENVTGYFYLSTLGIYYRFSCNIYLVWICGKTINQVIMLFPCFSHYCGWSPQGEGGTHMVRIVDKWPVCQEYRQLWFSCLAELLTNTQYHQQSCLLRFFVMAALLTISLVILIKSVCMKKKLCTGTKISFLRWSDQKWTCKRAAPRTLFKILFVQGPLWCNRVLTIKYINGLFYGYYRYVDQTFYHYHEKI